MTTKWDSMVKEGEGPYDNTGAYPCGFASVGAYTLTEPDKFAIVKTLGLRFHIICYNDGIAYVVAGDEERAKVKMTELKREYEARQTLNYGKDASQRSHVYWHIHTVEGELA